MTTTQIIDDLRLAADALRQGLLVAFPTETVYGLGADATNPIAIQRLFAAKGRPSDNPLIVHLGEVGQLSQAALSVSPTAWQLLDRFSPGPITVVVEKCSNVLDSVTAGLSSVGVRIPDQSQAQELLRLVNRPVAAPSANLSGLPSCTTWQSVLEDFNGKIDYVVKGEVSRIGIESTVVDCTRSQPVLLRAGAVTLEQLRTLLPNIICWNDRVRENSASQLVVPSSPGLRHAHYQPKANVRLVLSMQEALQYVQKQESAVAYFGLVPDDSMNQQSSEDGISFGGMKFELFQQFSSIEEYARRFYELLREADRREIREIFLQLVPDVAIGRALRDRQLRAAGKEGPSN